MLLYNKETDFLKNDINPEFIIADYDRKKPFSGFLPGIAGLTGIPLWAFYVNRAQAIAGFGLRDKNGAIMEFFPANAAYRYVDKIGFRTFVKCDGQVTEIFGTAAGNRKRFMRIAPSEVSIVEKNYDLALDIVVTYFILPEAEFAGLVRTLTIENRRPGKRVIEVLDGLAQILPAGVDYGGYKAVSNLLRSWMEATNLENKIAFYRLRASTADEAEVKTVDSGNFYMSFTAEGLLSPLCDPDMIFGMDTALTHPEGFAGKRLTDILEEEQVTANKVPCAFSGSVWTAENNDKFIMHSIIGHSDDIDYLNKQKTKLALLSYIKEKRKRSQMIVGAVSSPAATETAFPDFDCYMRQNFLDNVLRGGYPLLLGKPSDSKVYYVYSRKHGDLERDYNFFYLAPEFYSQGNGNFRDVCQNRRNDILFFPETDDFNIYYFASLIQADGYNPLAVNGTKFILRNRDGLSVLAPKLITSELNAILEKEFTPGALALYLKRRGVADKQIKSLIDAVIASSEQLISAEFGEGYWQDHWTYLLDLVETYLQVYPDRRYKLLFGRNDYRFFNSPAYVLPRAEKYCLVNGKIRQYGAVVSVKKPGNGWLQDESGKTLKTNLYGKLLLLVLCKFVLLDPEGIGISYEADKPGWNDAMNGLPGLFASGVGETTELWRLVAFLKAVSRDDSGEELILPAEAEILLDAVRAGGELSGFAAWDLSMGAIERYRAEIKNRSGGQKTFRIKELMPYLDIIEKKLTDAVNKALALGGGIIPTYLYYDVCDYEIIKDNIMPRFNHRGYRPVRVKAFSMKVLPSFLEAPARLMKCDFPGLNKDLMYRKIKESSLYDDKFSFYKTSVDLSGLSLEIGRIIAFTKGWLERESNFLHMTYKYLYGLLKGGLYRRFDNEIKTNFVCFMNPETYGRPIWENSSFIVPAVNPDRSLWGQGFVARLSGSTAEALSIRHLLFFGPELFAVKQGELVFKPRPLMSRRFFPENGTVKVRLFDKTDIIYINLHRINGYDAKVVKYELHSEAAPVTIAADVIGMPWSEKIRLGHYQTIKIYIEKEEED